MYMRVLLAAALLALTGIATASARVNMSTDSLIVAENDDDFKMQDDKMQSDDQNGEDESAKMGKEEGTHTGTDQGTTPESDTKKVEQPERRNVPTTDGDQN